MPEKWPRRMNRSPRSPFIRSARSSAFWCSRSTDRDALVDAPSAEHARRSRSRATSRTRALRNGRLASSSIFAGEIHSEHMMVLAARLARRQRKSRTASPCLHHRSAARTSRHGASTPEEDREGTAASSRRLKRSRANRARTFARRSFTRGASARQSLDLARKSEGAHLLVLGFVSRGQVYTVRTARPRDRRNRNARSKCDVLIGVPGQYGTLLVDEPIVEAATKAAT